jgi:nucleotide-binding universal stress UspA family protein
VPTIERILVPLDLNRLGDAKIPIAEAQARAFDAEIILLHVLPRDRSSGEAVSNVEAQARTYLDMIAARLHSAGIRARTLVRAGPPAETILDEIATQHADLVVLGSNVRHGLSRLLLGSVAEQIVARAGCPVLLVRPTIDPSEGLTAVRSFSDDAARVGPVAPRSLGLRTVEVSRVVGSVGRANELDQNFRSVNHRRAEEARYERVFHAMERGEPLPPVVLYKLGYGYYILDGNHRVAAARQLGQLEIEALVTEFVPLGDPTAQRVFAERRVFEQMTGLNRIGAATPGLYPRLEAMIHAYADEHNIADLRDAARRWEIDVYRPVAQRIRTERLGQSYPGDRTADVFLRIATYREEQSRLQDRPISWDEAFNGSQDAPESVTEGLSLGSEASESEP